jgi:DNA-cytosine methyltransferase
MNIISYYDGISCGQLALQRSGIKVDNYYAYEIDPGAIKVTQANFPNTIQMGSVVGADLTKLPEIDLLLGGSPCQSFSIAGNGKGFKGKSGLFWEFARCLKETKPKYFLFENVKPQKKEWADIISKELGVEYIIINSALVTGQRRRRHYWTNISNVQQPKDRGIAFESIIKYGNLNNDLYLSEKNITYGIEKHRGKVWKSGHKMGNMKFPNYTHKKSQCLMALEIKGARETNHIQDVNGIRTLSINEYLKLQGLPLGFTDVVSEKAAKSLVGNGWTIDVISHILSFIK